MDNELFVVCVRTPNGDYDDFEQMVIAEGDTEEYEIEWSNGDLTDPEGNYVGTIEYDEPVEAQVGPLKTYAYKAHANCRKCGAKLYKCVRDYTGNTVERMPNTTYEPTAEKLRKQCGDCSYEWYELPRDYRDKSSG